MTSGMSAMGFAQDDKCCAYDANGKGVHFDCVVIPGALNVAMTSLLGNFYQFCGRSAGLVAANMDVAANAKTICSDRQPFQIRFSSDGFEFPTEVAPATGGPNAGFKLIYTQTNKGCAPV
eukprot:maker-scaffold86_size395752-snap-gene-2.33 protein:Tk10886 transcript:maker-scaffold86_size395752-snap-gene-2.33-mRNA-1 annotation:"n-acetylmuramoyl-l-alanine amidase"